MALCAQSVRCVRGLVALILMLLVIMIRAAAAVPVVTSVILARLVVFIKQSVLTQLLTDGTTVVGGVMVTTLLPFLAHIHLLCLWLIDVDIGLIGIAMRLLWARPVELSAVVLIAMGRVGVEMHVDTAGRVGRRRWG